jgi:cell division protein FtsB
MFSGNKSPRQKEQSMKRRNKILAAGGFLFLFYLILNFFFGSMGLVRYEKLKGQRDGLRAEIAGLDASNKDLKNRVEALKSDPESIEKLARELGLVKQGETVYQYEDDK